MPLYDYDCANCGRRSEVLRGVHDVEPTACPLCGGGPLKKAFAAPAIHFKGSGWAKKERRATATPGASKASGGDGSKPDGGTSGSRSESGSTEATSGGGGSSATPSEGADKASSSTAGKASSAAASNGSSGAAGTGD